MRNILCNFLLVTLLAACDEAPLISSAQIDRLNNPISMALIPGTPYGVVANANINLEEQTGSLMAVDLDQQVVIPESAIAIPSFAGKVAVDAARSRIYLADRGNDAVLVYSYSIPGSGGSPISFSEIAAPTPPDHDIPLNGIETDEDPFDVLLVTTPTEDRIFTTNSNSGSISILTSDLAPAVDLNDEDGQLEGLPLISAANFQNRNKKPGRGANRAVLAPDGRLFYVTSTRNNQIYVIDSVEENVEAMIDLSSLSAAGDTRAMAVTTSNVAFIAHRALGGLLVLDVSNVTNNGIDMEVIEPQLIDVVALGRSPEGVVLSTDQLRVFVTVQAEGRVDMVDAATRSIMARSFVGVEPTEAILDSGRGVVYVLNVKSDSISVLDETSGDVLGGIE